MPDYLNQTFDDTPELADLFDDVPYWSAPFGRMILDRVDMRGLRSVLDIGCGTGFPMLELAERLGAGCTVYGVDPWHNAVERLRRKIAFYGITNAEVIEGGAEKVPLESGSIDLIVANLVLNNLADPRLVLTECHRLLRPGGRLAATTNLRGHWRELYDVFRATLTAMDRSDLLPALEEHEEHRGTIAGLRTLLAGMGLEVERTHEETLTMRYADGSAFLRHHFIRLGFLDAWKKIVPEDARVAVFTRLEEDLNAWAAERGELRLTVPMAYLEAVKG